MITLNKGQKQALEGFKAFLADETATCAVLTGAAGTGKTTSLKVMLAETGIGFKTIACAPTHKATIVLRGTLGSIVGMVNTVAAVFYAYNEDGGFFTLSGVEGAELVVVDESSMLGKKRTLDIIECAQKYHFKVLFVGDPFQLEPIKDTDAVFTYSLTEYYWVLSQVMRQQDGTDLLNYITAIRDQKKVLVPDKSAGDVRLGGKDMIRDLAQDIRDGISSIAIDYKNEDRFNHNADVRVELMRPLDVVIGEQMIATNNAVLDMGEKKIVPVPNATIFKASEGMKNYGTFQVTYFMPSSKVHSQEGGSIENNYSGYSSWIPFQVQASFFADTVVYEGQALQMKFVCLHRQPEATVQDGFISCDRLPRKIQETFCTLGKSSHWNLKKEIVVSNFGYSITCHKSQGSQWDKVYVTSAKNDCRWAYTAVSRAKKEVVIGFEGQKMTWDNIRAIADEYVSGKDATKLIQCDIEKMIAENMKRRKAEELSMMLKTQRGQVLKELGYGAVKNIAGCDKVLRDICGLIDLDAEIVLKEAWKQKEFLEDLVKMTGDIMKESIRQEEMNSQAAVKKGIDMIAAIRMRKSLPKGTAREIDGNKVVFMTKKQVVSGEIQDAINHEYNRGKDVEVRFEGYEKGDIIIDSDAINAILHSVRVEYGIEQEEIEVEKNIAAVENVTVETKEEENKMAQKELFRIYIATMKGQYPYDAERDEELVKTLVSYKFTGEDWNRQDLYEFKIVTGGNKDMQRADEAKGIKAFGFSMRTYYKCRGFKGVEVKAEKVEEPIYAVPDIDPSEYATDSDAAAQVEIDTVAHIETMENGRRVADIAAIDHYIASPEANEIATAAEEENVMNEQKMNETFNDEGCVVTRHEMIGYYNRSGYELPADYMDVPVEKLYWAYLELQDAAERAAEYDRDAAAMDGVSTLPVEDKGEVADVFDLEEEPVVAAEEPIIEEEPVVEKNATAKSVMIAAHQIRKIVAPELQKDGLMYKEIMSICLQVAWASARGKNLKEEFPWFMAKMAAAVIHKAKAANDNGVLAKAKAAQEAAKVNAEKRRAEAEKKAAKKDEARKRKALNELRYSVAQIVLGAYASDFAQAAKKDKNSDPAHVVRGIVEDLIATSATDKAKEVIADMKKSLNEAGLSMPLGIRVVNGERQYFMMSKGGQVVGPFKIVSVNGEIELADA